MQVTNDKAIVQFLLPGSHPRVRLRSPWPCPDSLRPNAQPGIRPVLAAGTNHASLKRRSTHPNLAVALSPAHGR
jgi:hypothetical protein